MGPRYRVNSEKARRSCTREREREKETEKEGENGRWTMEKDRNYGGSSGEGGGIVGKERGFVLGGRNRLRERGKEREPEPRREGGQ
jgi:hypothetical protein